MSVMICPHKCICLWMLWDRGGFVRCGWTFCSSVRKLHTMGHWMPRCWRDKPGTGRSSRVPMDGVPWQKESKANLSSKRTPFLMRYTLHVVDFVRLPYPSPPIPPLTDMLSEGEDFTIAEQWTAVPVAGKDSSGLKSQNQTVSALLDSQAFSRLVRSAQRRSLRPVHSKPVVWR
jgi:hypothetical protein